MAVFHYSARAKDGSKKEGDIEATNRNQVVKELQEKKLIVVKVDEKIALFESMKAINIGGIPLDEKVVFMRQLATMVSAGLPLAQGLHILFNQAKNPKFKEVIEDVLQSVEGGTSLSESFRKHEGVFDDITLNLIKAGENSGKLEEILLSIADDMEKNRDFKGKVKGAMIYPTVIGVVVVGVVVMVIVFMIPAVEDIFSEFGGELPFVTRILVNMSTFVRKFWWLVLILLSLAVFGVRYYLSTIKGKIVWDSLKLKIPIFGPMAQKIELATFTSTMHLLVSSGLNLLDALELTAGSLSNSNFRNTVKDAMEQVRKGTPLSVPLSKSEVFPLIVGNMVGVGEETGKLDEVLGKLADYYSKEIERLTENLASLMEPLMLIIMGGVIGFIAIAVYLPMFSLANVVG
ncbi:MAG: type II secretion system F family protein [bacterium]